MRTFVIKPIFIAASMFMLLMLLSTSALASQMVDSGNGGGPGTPLGPGNDSSANPLIWDIANSERKLPWTSTLQSAKKEITDASSEKDIAKAEEKFSRAIGRDRCSNYNNASCVLWDNTSKYSSQWGYEVHRPTSAGGPVGDNAIIGWNIKIWREGEETPIFERRVCDNDSPGKGTDTDNYAATTAWNTRWWNCGASNRTEGGFQRSGDSKSGMLSNESNAACQVNWKNADNGKRKDKAGNLVRSIARAGSKTSLGAHACYWEGKQLGSFAYDGQFGKTDVDDTGLEEAVRLEWKLSPSSRKQSIKYAIDGVPGQVYVVQIIGIDWKERMIPIFNGSPFAVSDSGNHQYLRAFIPAPKPTVCVPGPPPCPGSENPSPVDNGEPQPTVNLEVDSPLQVREQGNQSVTLDMDKAPLSNKQAVFPTFTQLYHLTPQADYNEGMATSYGPTYITYDSDIGRRTSLGYGLSAPGTDKPWTMATLPQSPNATVLTRNAGTLAQNSYKSTWLQTTLSNPCQDVRKNFAYNLDDDSSTSAGPWSASSQDCNNTSTTRNTWDDYMAASMKWEARWVSTESTTPNYQYIRGASLRCDNALEQVDRFKTDGEAINECDSTYIGSQNYKKGSTQYFQGMLNLSSNDNSRKDYATGRQASARIILTTNAADKISQMAMWNRESGSVQGLDGYKTDDNTCANDPSACGNEFSNNSKQPITNTVSTAKELNFCEQGLPSGSKIYRGSNPASDTTNGSSSKGDPDCTGFAVKWRWDDAPETCRISRSATTPAASAFKAPTALIFNRNSSTAVDGTQTNMVLGWGTYGLEYANSQKAYSTGTATNGWSVDTELRQYGVDTGNTSLTNPLTAANQAPKRPPYVGTRPGRTYNEQDCTRTISGKWRTGSWSREYVFTKVDPSLAANQLFVRAFETSAGGRYEDNRNLVTDDLGNSPTPYLASERNQDIPYGSKPSGAPDGEATEVSSRGGIQRVTYGAWTNSNVLTQKECPSAGRNTDVLRYICSDNDSDYKFTETKLERNQNSCPNGYTEGSRAFDNPYAKGYCIASGKKWNVHTGEWNIKAQEQTRTKNVRTYSRNRYTFGYWHYVYKWTWGSSDPEQCIDANSTNADKSNKWWDTNGNSVLDISETTANNNYRYAGALYDPGKYGRTDFVWSHGGTTPDSSSYGDEEARYNAETNAIRKRHNGNDMNVVSNSVWTNSQDCTVSRSGKRQSGQWNVANGDVDQTESLSTSGNQAKEYGEFSEAGWGANNTGPRVPNGAYTVQFTFKGLSDLGTPSQYCNDRQARNTDGLPPRYCWSMKANYDGRADYQWTHVTRKNDMHSEESSALVSVYGPRNSR